MAAPVACRASPGNDTRIGFEIKLAQALAGNEKRKRDRTLKKLEKWLLARTQSKIKPFVEEDMLRVWKGLHYCMWMSDKPLVQEDLAERISGLVHIFKSRESMITWLAVFLETQSREWNGIDRLRLDKFMMLIRYVLRQSLGYLKRLGWPQDLIEKWLEVVFGTVVGAGSKSPDGLKMHIVDIIHGELTLVGADDLTSEKITTFLHPFCEVLSRSKSVCVTKRLVNSLFLPIIKSSLVGLEEENESDDEEEAQNLKIDYQAVADDLFQLGSSEGCTGTNRTTAYNLVKKFRDLAGGIFPVEEISSGEEEELTPAQIKKAAADLRNFEAGLLKEKKKRKRTKKKKTSIADDQEQDGGGDAPNHVDVSEETDAKTSPKNHVVKKASKAKKRKTVPDAELRSSKGNGDDVSPAPKKRKKQPKIVEVSSPKNDPESPKDSAMDTSTLQLGLDTFVAIDNSSQLQTEKMQKKKKKKLLNGTSGSPGEMNFVKMDELPKAKFFKKSKAAKNASPNVVEAEMTPTKFNSPDSETLSAKKRVMFQMHQNRAQEFKESLKLSPIVPFNPKRQPEQGILKSPLTPASSKVKVKVMVSPKVKTPKVRKPPSTFTPTMISAPDKKKKKRKTSL